MHIYENHLGGLYAENYEVNFDDLYCEQCGDYDWEIGCFDTMAEFLTRHEQEIPRFYKRWDELRNTRRFLDFCI